MPPRNSSLLIIIGLIFAAGIVSTAGGITNALPQIQLPEVTRLPTPLPTQVLSATNQFLVSRVVDGDTIQVTQSGQTFTVRLIGVNTPESVDPRREVECYGIEASNFLKNLLTGKTVTLESDSTQTDRDRYDRLLRYVFLPDQTLVNQLIIAEGYGYEYTYDDPYQYQQEFLQAQSQAQNAQKGLWNPDACNITPTPTIAPGCQIKGNINAVGDKLYHLPSCSSYKNTIINLNQGEKWFCTEEEATIAGWKKANTCP